MTLSGTMSFIMPGLVGKGCNGSVPAHAHHELTQFRSSSLHAIDDHLVGWLMAKPLGAIRSPENAVNFLTVDVYMQCGMHDLLLFKTIPFLKSIRSAPLQ